ncbi:hypothetical protein KR038_004658 [Drosophila bunnanda]|nr:hypothetical protein KR038_004658 [Drosophila bunnanda]
MWTATKTLRRFHCQPTTTTLQQQSAQKSERFNDYHGDVTTRPFPSAEPEESTQPSVPNPAVSASELAKCRAENWLLKKKLREYEVTIENLEQLVSTLVEKQHHILSDIFNLRAENHELQSECHLQREYHSMERNALLKQLNDAQVLYQNRATTLVSLATPPGHCKCSRSPSHRKVDRRRGSLLLTRAPRSQPAPTTRISANTAATATATATTSGSQIATRRMGISRQAV